MPSDKQIIEIKERNARVEADKAWETSRTRRLLVAFSIYIVAFVSFSLINTPKPALDALVPSVAYILSTLTLPFLKNWWMKSIYKR